MPFVIQCQNCFLAFNLGITGSVNAYRRFAFCGACGTVHVIRFHPDDRDFVLDEVSFDSEGPRTIETPQENEQRTDAPDITLSSPVVPSDALSRCNGDVHGRHFDDVNDFFSVLQCGGCSATDLRIVVRDDTECPRCRSLTLRDVGGWL